MTRLSRRTRSLRRTTWDDILRAIGAYYPETNPLLPLAHHDAKSKIPAAKSIPVVVRPQ
jgi:hypothetical protein